MKYFFVLCIFQICRIGDLDVNQAAVTFSFVYHMWLNSVLPLNAAVGTGKTKAPICPLSTLVDMFWFDD